MSIMPCYPDERAVENELGGKWELFFEETRDETGAVGYEWDKDFDDTPLNLLGIKIILANTSPISIPATRTTFNVNGTEILNTQFSINNYKMILDILIKNGFTDTTITRADGTTSLFVPSKTFSGVTYITDCFNKFTMSIGSVLANTNIKIYVLRGV